MTIYASRCPCGRCGRTDSVYQAPRLDLVVCMACGYEESGEMQARRRYGDGPKVEIEGKVRP